MGLGEGVDKMIEYARFAREKKNSRVVVMMDPSKKAAIKCLIYPKIPPSCMLPMNCFKNASIKCVCFPLSPPSPHFTDKSFVKDESFKMTAIDYTPPHPVNE